MDRVTFKLQKESLKISGNKLITGAVYFDFGSFQFPEKDWDDFIVIILKWWLVALARIIYQGSKSEELRFMDGPLLLNIKVLNNDLWGIQCLYNHKMIYEGGYSGLEFTNSVLKSVKIVIDQCEKYGWQSKDVDDLKLAYQDFLANRNAKNK